MYFLNQFSIHNEIKSIAILNMANYYLKIQDHSIIQNIQPIHDSRIILFIIHHNLLNNPNFSKFITLKLDKINITIFMQNEFCV